MLAKQILPINPKKNKWTYLTKAGRHCSFESPFIGCNQIEYLGFAVQANHCLRVKRKYNRQFLAQIRSRITTAAHLTRHLSQEQRGLEICSAVREAMRSNSPLIVSYIQRYYSQHDDRQQLKQMDRQIALWIAQALTGRRNETAFRLIPYRTIRQKWGLPSLCYIRNQRPKSES